MNWLDLGDLDIIFNVSAVETLTILVLGTSIFSENTIIS